MSKNDTTTTEKATSNEAMTLKNFRSNSDIENFYRYIHDNGLRREAFMMLEYAIGKVAKARKGKRGRASTLQ